jgi:hypothetical protein
MSDDTRDKEVAVEEVKFWLALIEPHMLSMSWVPELTERRDGDEPPYSNDNGVYQYPIILTHYSDGRYPTLTLEKWFTDAEPVFGMGQTEKEA